MNAEDILNAPSFESLSARLDTARGLVSKDDREGAYIFLREAVAPMEDSALRRWFLREMAELLDLRVTR